MSPLPALYVLLLAYLAGEAQSHGVLISPRSRNWVAHEEGIEGIQAGVPKREYCQHCLNTNNGVCGVSPEFDYDPWLDSTGQAMPWKPQGTFVAGDTIRIKTFLSTHHNGHMEIRGCPYGRASTQTCFDQPNHALTFVRDVLHDMPADSAHPERGYFYGGQWSGTANFEMEFKLPDELVGPQVLLQWKYITANSCSPPGYANYFAGQNSQSKVLNPSFWNSALPACQLPYPQDGSRSAVWPEQFFNCAEVGIESSQPSSSKKPSPAPITAAPTQLRGTAAPAPPPIPTSSGGAGCCSQDFKSCISWCGSTKETCGSCNQDETFIWLDGGAIQTSCEPRWGTCTENSSVCCDGLTCEEQTQWYSQCLPEAIRGHEEPDPVPVASPVSSPIAPPAPIPSTAGCCSHDFKTCVDWCGTTIDSCGSCNPSDSYQWLSQGASSSTCVARWGDCTSSSTICCDGLSCVAQSQWYSQCLPTD